MGCVLCAFWIELISLWRHRTVYWQSFYLHKDASYLSLKQLNNADMELCTKKILWPTICLVESPAHSDRLFEFTWKMIWEVRLPRVTWKKNPYIFHTLWSAFSVDRCCLRQSSHVATRGYNSNNYWLILIHSYWCYVFYISPIFMVADFILHHEAILAQGSKYRTKFIYINVDLHFTAWWQMSCWCYFHKPLVLETCNSTPPTELELLVSAKIVHPKFHGVLWNCLFHPIWPNPSSMEFHEIGVLHLPWNSMEFHGTASVNEVGALQVPWNSMDLLLQAT